jgi:hypothetical protein
MVLSCDAHRHVLASPPSTDVTEPAYPQVRCTYPLPRVVSLSFKSREGLLWVPHAQCKQSSTSQHATRRAVFHAPAARPTRGTAIASTAQPARAASLRYERPDIRTAAGHRRYARPTRVTRRADNVTKPKRSFGFTREGACERASGSRGSRGQPAYECT